MILGIIGAVAKDFFNSQIDMKIVNQMEEVERTGKKEHVVFLISSKPVFSEKLCSKNASPSQRSHASGCRINTVHMNKQVKRTLVVFLCCFFLSSFCSWDQYFFPPCIISVLTIIFGGIINIDIVVHHSKPESH